MKIVDDNKLGLVEYPSEQFNFIVEEFTKIILESINAENNFNHILTKIFVSALLFNSGCYAQKLIEYFNILFSYTRNYLSDEEKYLDKLKNKYQEHIKNLINCINNYLEKEKKEKKNERFPIYFPLIRIKEIIEENNINLKDKYVEFLFYFLKKFNDNNAKLDELKYNLLNYILEQNIENYDKNKEEEDNKENEEENKEQKEENKFEENNNDKINLDNNIENKTTGNINNNQEKNMTNNIGNENTNTNINNSNENKINNNKGNEKDINLDEKKENKAIEQDSNIKTDKKNENTNSNMEDSMTEITNEEYIKQINDAIRTIKNGLKKNNNTFSEFIRDIKQNLELDNKIIECFTIDDFNEKLKEIGIVFSDLKLSCLCSKYSLPNELRIIEIKNIEEDINSK